MFIKSHDYVSALKCLQTTRRAASTTLINHKPRGTHRSCHNHHRPHGNDPHVTGTGHPGLYLGWRVRPATTHKPSIFSLSSMRVTALLTTRLLLLLRREARALEGGPSERKHLLGVGREDSELGRSTTKGVLPEDIEIWASLQPMF